MLLQRRVHVRLVPHRLVEQRLGGHRLTPWTWWSHGGGAGGAKAGAWWRTCCRSTGHRGGAQAGGPLANVGELVEFRLEAHRPTWWG